MTELHDILRCSNTDKLSDDPQKAVTADSGSWYLWQSNCQLYDPYQCSNHRLSCTTYSWYSPCQGSEGQLTQLYNSLQCRPTCYTISPRNGVLRTQKSMTRLLRTKNSKVLLLKPGVGQNVAMRALTTATDFFLEIMSIFPVHSPSFLFQNLFRVFPVLAVAKAGSCAGLQNNNRSPCSLSQKIGAGGSRVECPWK